MDKILIASIYGSLLITAFFYNVFLKLESALMARHSATVEYLVTNEESAWLLLIFGMTVLAIAALIKIFNKAHLYKPLVIALGTSLALSLAGIFAADMYWMSANGERELLRYFADEWWLYIILLSALLITAGLRRYFFKKQYSEAKDTTGKFGSAAWALKKDLEVINAYDKESGTLIGLDENNHELYVPFRGCNKINCTSSNFMLECI